MPISIDNMVSIIKIAKGMKRPVIQLRNNKILGTDEEFCTLSKIDIDTGIDKPITFKITDSLLQESAIEKYSSAHPDIFFAEYKKIIDGFYINGWAEIQYADIISDMWERIAYYINYSNIVYSETGLEKNEQFMSLCKAKVSDGLQYYNIDNKYLQTSFNKIHCINSKDKVSLNIYDIDMESLLYEYIIDKKKYVVNQYVRYRKMY